MGIFNKEKVSEIDLSIYSLNEVEDLVVRMAKLIEEGYSIIAVSDFRYSCTTSNFIQNEPIFTIKLTKNMI